MSTETEPTRSTNQVDDLQSQLFGTTRLANRLLRVLVTLEIGGKGSGEIAEALKGVFIEEKENLLANAKSQVEKFDELGAPDVIVEKSKDVVSRIGCQLERARMLALVGM